MSARGHHVTLMHNVKIQWARTCALAKRAGVVMDIIALVKKQFPTETKFVVE